MVGERGGMTARRPPAGGIAQQRLRNQRLVGKPCARAEDVVSCLGAVQAQDYAAAKWAVAQRTAGILEADLDRAFDEGRILRTHVLRPTWHFVAPADIRWMLALSAARVNAASAYYYRTSGLGDDLFARSRTVLARALRGGTHLTRAELCEAYRRADIDPSGLRVGLLMMRAELDGVICSGPRRGKQFTYALLDERVPPSRALARDEAATELARRYFTSHGPAQLPDFCWWSGLTAALARQAIARAGLRQEIIDGKTYWRGAAAASTRLAAPLVHLLPNFDELTVAYKDRTATVDPRWLAGRPRSEAVMAPVVVLDGRAVGGWRP
jgi:hypothetical protein